MKISLIKDTLDLLYQFHQQQSLQADKSIDIQSFQKWIIEQHTPNPTPPELTWEGKTQGRSEDSVISTLIVHMNRYAKIYSKAAMQDAEFSTQDEFIYLIVLKSFGEMTKMELIKRNIHEKPAGMKLIDRLLQHGWVTQKKSTEDKRSKLIQISPKGMDVLEKHMNKIRQASQIVTGNLTQQEKHTLIHLLQKLADFHQPIYQENLPITQILEQGLIKKQKSI